VADPSMTTDAREGESMQETKLDDADPIRRLRTDLASFGDPGSPVLLRQQGNGWVEASWEEDGRARSARILVGPAGPERVATSGGGEQSYSSFLAGPDMGNLRALARNTLHVIKPLPSFVPSLARLEGEPPQDGQAVELLVGAAEPTPDLTSVVFVAADAGVGKTVLLKEVVRRQAERYLAGEATSLWLYVDAQARRLAALDEAMAGELDRVRAKFSYDAAVPLVRTGALTLVVDGFDELIGSVGAYDEAFASLADFIANLDGGGTIVAAARSAYYEQEFLARVSRGLGRGERWQLRPLRLREWRPDQRYDFVIREASRAGRTAEEASSAYNAVEEALSGGELAGVAGKPFFVARTTELVLDGGLPSDEESVGLLDRLVTAYLEREAGKLLSSSRAPLLSVEGLRSLFHELATEMWRQETRELSRSTLKELAAILGEMEGLDEDGVREVATRAPYFAMLREGSLPGSVGWEHDVYFAYFLSRPLAEVIAEQDPRKLARILRRGRLPEDAALLAGKLSRALLVQDAVDLLASAVAVEEVDVDRVRRNAGLLAGGIISGGAHEGLKLRGLAVGDISLTEALFTNCTLGDVSFAGTDFTTTRFEGCELTAPCHLDRVVVDPRQTVLSIAGLSVEAFYGIVVRGEEGDRLSYAPTEIREILQACGLPSAIPELSLRNVNQDVVELLERLCKVYARTNVVVEAEDNDLVSITTDPYWTLLRRGLVESGLVVPRAKPASGHRTFLERTVTAADLMAGLDTNAKVSEAVDRFWTALERRAPAV
jgi:hypothetical protein